MGIAISVNIKCDVQLLIGSRIYLLQTKIENNFTKCTILLI